MNKRQWCCEVMLKILLKLMTSMMVAMFFQLNIVQPRKICILIVIIISSNSHHHYYQTSLTLHTTFNVFGSKWRQPENHFSLLHKCISHTHTQSDLYKIPKALSKCKKPNAKKQILSYALYCYTKQKQETQISLPTTTKNKSARIQEKQKKRKIVKWKSQWLSYGCCKCVLSDL